MAKNPVSTLLKKRGLKIEELTQEERNQIEEWKKTLSESDLTAESLLVFCDIQLANIERQFKDLDTPPEKQTRLILLHNVYSTLKGVIHSPKQKKEALAKYLESLL